VGVEEMNREDEPRGEQRLVRVDDRGDVENPSRQEKGEKLREPEHQTREADGEHPPEDREEIELLPIGPSIERRFGSLVEEPADHSDDVLDVFPAGTERIGSEEPLKGIGISW